MQENEEAIERSYELKESQMTGLAMQKNDQIIDDGLNSSRKRLSFSK
jgi:hypothetical protein